MGKGLRWTFKPITSLTIFSSYFTCWPHCSLEWLRHTCSGHYTWLSPHFSIVPSQLRFCYFRALGHTVGTDFWMFQSLLKWNPQAPSAQKLSTHIPSPSLLGMLDSYPSTHSNPVEYPTGIDWDTDLQDSDFSSPLSLQVGLVLPSSHFVWIPSPLTSTLITCSLISIWQAENHF